MSPARLHSKLIWCEVDGRLAPDCRRILSREREQLGMALQRGDAAAIRAAATEAANVADMWGVKL